MAVNAFLNAKISFIEIAEIVSMTMEAHDIHSNPRLEDIINADAWARKEAADLIKNIKS